MRLFVAAEVPAEVRARLEQVQEGLNALPFRVRWVRKEAIHLTFVFLGEVPPARLETIAQALGRPEASPVGPFGLVVRGLGTFPRDGRPRVIWAGLAGDLDAAGRLKKGLDAVLSALGFRAEERSFAPHLTIGRVTVSRGREDGRSILEPFAAREFGSFEVDAAVLYESRLRPQGAEYVILHRFPLGAAMAAG